VVIQGHVEYTFCANAFSLYDADLVLLCICLAAKTPVAVQLLKLNVDVLCVAPSHMSGVDAVTYLVISALCDQLISMSKMVKKNASQNPKVQFMIIIGGVDISFLMHSNIF
jgi:hypothetical protein